MPTLTMITIIIKSLLILITTLAMVCKSEEEIPIKTFNLTSQDGHDSPTLVQEKTKIERVNTVKCSEVHPKSDHNEQSGLHSNSVKGWAIFLFVCLALIIVAMVAALSYKVFRDNSPNMFEKIYPGIQVQEDNKPINSGRNTIIQV